MHDARPQKMGILGLQGAVMPHVRHLQELGIATQPVRRATDLHECAGLILPGGESSTMLNLITHYALQPALTVFAHERPIWGICAGSILMAETVVNPTQK